MQQKFYKFHNLEFLFYFCMEFCPGRCRLGGDDTDRAER